MTEFVQVRRYDVDGKLLLRKAYLVNDEGRHNMSLDAMAHTSIFRMVLGLPKAIKLGRGKKSYDTLRQLSD